MAQIFIKGQQQPIEVENKPASSIKQEWKHAKPHEIIDLGSISFRCSEIKAILLDGETFGAEEQKVYEMSTERLKEIIGSFEEEWKQHSTGERVNNKILGPIRQGIINWALELGAIFQKDDYWFIVMPAYKEFELKRNAMRELQCRREYAQKMNPLPMQRILSEQMNISDEIKTEDIF